ncbi:MAG: M48 family metallopeptidase [Planctomycetes bacterium]|nr:M48 family metallopeptidase [Planctomycetota bacterium]
MFELIRANKIKSWLLILTLTSVLVVLGWVIGEVWAPGGGVGGIAVAVVIATVMNLLAYYAGDQMVLAMSGARQIEHKDLPQLFNVVEEVSIAGGVPMPKVYVIDDTAMNAFATGRDPRHASVAITKGLLMKLNRDELQGVMAHELSHIKNRDMLYMTLAAILVGAVALLADMFLRGLWYSGAGVRRRRSDREGGGGAQAVLIVIGILAAILAPIVARLLYLACSRRREYLADASAAMLTRYPEGLASALEKISGDREILEAANRATAHMYIVHPVKSFEERASALMSTHPPVEERIAILRGMGHSASMSDYQAAWQRYHKGQRLAPKAALAAAPPPPPARPPAEGPRAPETQEDRLRRAHEALDTFRRLGGFLFIPCACGVKLKVPPGYARPQVRCPRCGVQHSLAEGSEAGAAGQ